MKFTRDEGTNYVYYVEVIISRQLFIETEYFIISSEFRSVHLRDFFHFFNVVNRLSLITISISRNVYNYTVEFSE